MPADLVESLRDFASFHSKDHHQQMIDISRQRIGQVMKEAAWQVGIDLARAHPHAFRHTYAATACCEAFRSPCCRSGWGTPPWSTPNATWSWPGRTTSGLAGCELG